MHNRFIVINKSTAYQAPLGTQPSILPPLEGGDIKENNEQCAVHGGLHRRNAVHDLSAEGLRDLARAREIAAAQIIEATALSRLQMANIHKTVAAVERSEHAPNDLVDIWYEPSNKEFSGWRGPAQVVTINDREGNMSVRFQGRTLHRKPQEVRPHVPYLVYALGLFEHKGHALLHLATHAENMKKGIVKTLGTIFSYGWHLSGFSSTREGSELLQSALLVAHQCLYLSNVVQVRLCRGCAQLPAPGSAFTEAETLVWCHGSSGHGTKLSKQSVKCKTTVTNTSGTKADFFADMVILSSEPGDLAQPFLAK